MKVSLVMTSKGLGGVQQLVVPYALALERVGYEIQILVMAQSGLMRELMTCGLGERVTPLKRGWKIYRYLSNPEMKKHVSSFAPDIVIGFAQMGFFEAWRALRLFDVPIVTHVGSMKTRRLRSFHSADGWLATTPEMKDALAALGFPLERIFLVPNFLAATSAPRPVTGLATPPRVGALGRLVPRKGFHVLVDAIALLRDRGVKVECEIAGDGESRAALAAQIEKLDLGCVKLVGWLEGERKAQFVERLDLLVVPSLDEPFGLVYLDAMCVGTPIITGPTVGARFIFSAENSAEFVPFADPPALADAIERVLSCEDRRLTLAVSAREAFDAKFGLDGGARSLKRALETAVSLGRTYPVARHG